MDLKDIKAIIDLMKKNSITEFELERQDFKIKLKRGHAGAGAGEDAGAIYLPQPMAPLSLPGQAGGTAAAAQAAPASNELEIKSPMVGTFYRAPSPESAPYVDVGTEVSPDTVVCIIEAMKVMNEIKSEVRGVITQILLDNSKPVEFGQAIFKVRPI